MRPQKPLNQPLSIPTPNILYLSLSLSLSLPFLRVWGLNKSDFKLQYNSCRQECKNHLNAVFAWVWNTHSGLLILSTWKVFFLERFNVYIFNGLRPTIIVIQSNQFTLFSYISHIGNFNLNPQPKHTTNTCSAFNSVCKQRKSYHFAKNTHNKYLLSNPIIKFEINGVSKNRHFFNLKKKKKKKKKKLPNVSQAVEQVEWINIIIVGKVNDTV